MTQPSLPTQWPLLRIKIKLVTEVETLDATREVGRVAGTLSIKAGLGNADIEYQTDYSAESKTRELLRPFTPHWADQSPLYSYISNEVKVSTGHPYLYLNVNLNRGTGSYVKTQVPVPSLPAKVVRQLQALWPEPSRFKYYRGAHRYEAFAPMLSVPPDQWIARFNETHRIVQTFFDQSQAARPVPEPAGAVA